MRGVGSASGGRSELRHTDEKACALALQRTLQEAGGAPDSVGYLELHGSGLAAEDALERKVLSAFFGAQASELPCYLGSVKADIGHAGAASGLASLVKTALCLHRQILPPLRAGDGDPPWRKCARDFRFPAGAQFWLRNRADGPRRALVSGFASDGNCAHVLLEGYEEKNAAVRPSGDPLPLGPLGEAIFAVEADTADALIEGLTALRHLVAAQPAMRVEALAAHWLQTAPLSPVRRRCLALVADSRRELMELLQQGEDWLRQHPEQRLDGSGGNALPGPLRDRLFYNPAPLATSGRIAFIFPGSGNHFAGMGRELSARWPAIFRRQDAQNRYLARQFRPGDFWNARLDEAVHDNHNALVIGQVALGTAVSDLVRSFGIAPQAVSGYSLGESAGLFSFGAWQDRDGMASRLAASTLFTEELAGACLAARQVWGLPKTEKFDWLLGLAAAPASAGAAGAGRSRARLPAHRQHPRRMRRRRRPPAGRNGDPPPRLPFPPVARRHHRPLRSGAAGRGGVSRTAPVSDDAATRCHFLQLRLGQKLRPRPRAHRRCYPRPGAGDGRLPARRRTALRRRCPPFSGNGAGQFVQPDDRPHPRRAPASGALRLLSGAGADFPHPAPARPVPGRARRSRAVVSLSGAVCRWRRRNRSAASLPPSAAHPFNRRCRSSRRWRRRAVP